MKKSFESFLQLGISKQNLGEYREAIANYEKALRLSPKNYLIRINLGLCHINLGNLNIAVETLHQLHEDFPEDFKVLKFCGAAYAKIGQFELAIKFLKRALNIKPNDFDCLIEISVAAAANQQDIDALYYSTQALSINPTNPIAHNNLGTALMTIGRLSDALYCFETSLKLDPNNMLAFANSATIYEKQGNLKKSISILEECLLRAKPGSIQEAEIKFKLSLPLLHTGQLKKGWKYYNEGFKPKNTRTRTPKRHFDVPEWQGQPLGSKRLLVWGEQGLGDEFMFFHVLPEIFPYCDNIIIETTPRLVSIFQRSFPTCEVRANAFDDSILLNSTQRDFDFHIPVGSLMSHFRSEINDFSRNKPYIKSDTLRLEIFKNRLSVLQPKRLIGICWRSGKVSADRNMNYIPISFWKPIFDVPNTEFINLQYGDCREEIQQAEQEFGIKIHQWSDVDLKDDQESVAAIIQNLDCVISAGTAVAQLTMAIGTPLKLFTPTSWTFLGQDKYPWSSNVDVYICNPEEPPEKPLIDIAKSLQA